jgi:hypothetical protein
VLTRRSHLPKSPRGFRRQRPRPRRAPTHPTPRPSTPLTPARLRRQGLRARAPTRATRPAAARRRTHAAAGLKLTHARRAAPTPPHAGQLRRRAAATPRGRACRARAQDAVLSAARGARARPAQGAQCARDTPPAASLTPRRPTPLRCRDCVSARRPAKVRSCTHALPPLLTRARCVRRAWQRARPHSTGGGVLVCSRAAGAPRALSPAPPARPPHVCRVTRQYTHLLRVRAALLSSCALSDMCVARTSAQHLLGLLQVPEVCTAVERTWKSQVWLPSAPEVVA